MRKMQDNISSSWLPRTLSPETDTEQGKGKGEEKSDWLPHAMVVETTIVADKRKTDSVFSSMTMCLNNKKIVWIIVIYAVIATGLWSLFLGNPFQFGKKDQGEALKEQVGILGEEVEELESQVNRLSSQVTRLSNETDRLEKINKDLKVTAEDLNKTISALGDLNDSLNITTSQREDLGEKLQGSVSTAKEINNVLIDSLTDLGERIESITDLNDELKSTKRELEEEKEVYIGITETLETSNIFLAKEVDSLESQLVETQSQNQFLSKNNDDLRSLIEFLNQAGLDLNATTEKIAEYLVEEIAENSALVLRDLELSYQNIYSYWFCTSSFEDIFSNKPWMTNKNSEIGEGDYDIVIKFVDDNVLGHICATRTDFENFLVSDQYIDYNGPYPPVDISLNVLKSGIERYSTKMTEYYFTPDGNGLTANDWTEYRYDCQNIPPERRYVWAQDR